jgi:hypothetical protein
VTSILARVTTPVRTMRGADGLLRVEIPREWLGRTSCIRIELPRNLACANCGGGGCDACGLSGAITLRERHDPSESVVVNLSALSVRNISQSSEKCPSFVVRVPERGGPLRAGVAGATRGCLLVTVACGDTASPGVERMDDEPSEELCTIPESRTSIRVPSLRPVAGWLKRVTAAPSWRWFVVGVILALVGSLLVGLIY